MSFFHGQMVVWYRQMNHNKSNVVKTPATFLALCGKESAYIAVDGQKFRVKRDNIEGVKNA
jgi:hypothetical protein